MQTDLTPDATAATAAAQRQQQQQHLRCSVSGDEGQPSRCAGPAVRTPKKLRIYLNSCLWTTKAACTPGNEEMRVKKANNGQIIPRNKQYQVHGVAAAAASKLKHTSNTLLLLLLLLLRSPGCLHTTRLAWRCLGSPNQQGGRRRCRAAEAPPAAAAAAELLNGSRKKESNSLLLVCCCS